MLPFAAEPASLLVKINAVSGGFNVVTEIITRRVSAHRGRVRTTAVLPLLRSVRGA